MSDFVRGYDAGVRYALSIIETSEALNGTDHRAIKLALRSVLHATPHEVADPGEVAAARRSHEGPSVEAGVGVEERHR